ncbi:uncharacterized protein LOC123509305 isoform X2 [Portunus trituberculatus]|uniref:uncharacterized protein LOC123509305 isoform X2 n=1 Tax=Portunus trituberculatus TaxID=210409 RepID=UPI001E1CC5C1|nr:uncharacterized protein LOC123509305 isoform X2 [Portunus trituberculatus]
MKAEVGNGPVGEEEENMEEGGEAEEEEEDIGDVEGPSPPPTVCPKSTRPVSCGTSTLWEVEVSQCAPQPSHCATTLTPILHTISQPYSVQIIG